MKKILLAITATALFIMFIAAQVSLPIKDKSLNEVSGIVSGRTNPNLYYVMNDSGGKAEVYALSAKGAVKAILKLNKMKNRDWEDIAIGPGRESGSHYIYVGDIGDNSASHQRIYLYRFIEPKLSKKQLSAAKPRTVEVEMTDKITIRWEDGARDCEALFIDPSNSDVYLVTKREEKVGLYRVAAPLKLSEDNVAKRVADLDFSLAVAADISPKRDNVIIKNYADIYLWKLKPGESIAVALKAKPIVLPYKAEPQGEAVCFSSDGKSYLTLSEKHEKIPLYLHRYQLKK